MMRPLPRLVLGLTMSLIAVSAETCFGQTASFAAASSAPAATNQTVMDQTVANQRVVRRAPQRFSVEEVPRADAAAQIRDTTNVPKSVVPVSNPSTLTVPDPFRGSPDASKPSHVSSAGDGEFGSDVDTTAIIRAIAPQARQLIVEGLKLAAKGAAFSARARFIAALQLISDSLDAKQSTQSHSQALTAGLTALREADDFSRPAAVTAGGTDPIVQSASHCTPLIKNARQGSITRLEALQLYYSYATAQLAAAAGGAPEASMALYYLGRLQPFLGISVDRSAILAEPKALALQQTAVLVDPQNFHAANELGVLLARCGQLSSARKALLYSASIEKRTETFQNLAVVYKGLGDDPAANSMTMLADQEKQRRGRSPNQNTIRPLVYWVDHKTFSGDAPNTDLDALSSASSSDARPAQNSAVKRVKPAAALQYQAPGIPPQPDAVEQQSQDFLQPFTWEIFAQGEYIGPARLPHVPEYYLRVDDSVLFVFRLTGKPTATAYRLNVGDTIRIASLTMPSLTQDSLIQPDGTIILPQVGAIVAAGKSIEELRAELEDRFRRFLKEPGITITPTTINKTVEELRNAIINRNGIYAGQSFHAKISPNGTIQLPALGSVPAQGLTLTELRTEVERRYAEIVEGVEITPVLTDRAPRSVYVLGEVQKPGKFPLDAPTTVMQAIALAGSWNIGGNVKQIIVFRRDQDWRLMCTKVNIRPALYNYGRLYGEDIWIRDNDIVLVPKYPIQVFDDWVNLIFTRGIYGIIPFQGISFSFFQDLQTIGQLTTGL